LQNHTDIWSILPSSDGKPEHDFTFESCYQELLAASCFYLELL